MPGLRTIATTRTQAEEAEAVVDATQAGADAMGVVASSKMLNRMGVKVRILTDNHTLVNRILP